MRTGQLRDVLETHLAYVYRFALQLTDDPHAAQDIAQETMLRAWRRRKRLRDVRAAKGWLLTIATNLWRDQVRRRRRRPAIRMPPDADPPAAEQPVGQLVAYREAVERVRQRMARLPPRQRQVLYLSAFEELGHQEIAAVLSISVGAVKASLSHARRALRESLGEHDPAYEAKG